MVDAGPILYQNLNQVLSGSIGPAKLPDDYILACRFLHCGIIDRTGSLQTGFPVALLDAIPEQTDHTLDFGQLCDARGRDIVNEAMQTGRMIDVLWSGGIDSTAALIAIVKAATEQNVIDLVTVLLSMDSVLENPIFFLDQIRPSLAIRSIVRPISQQLDPAVLTVTGEHGDQLFGSQLLRGWVERGLAGEPYQDILPIVILDRVRNPLHARRVMRYLAPVIEAAPVSLVSLFDVMWWLNFALKWQAVSLRLPVMAGSSAGAVFRSTRHFFRTDDFQRWSMAASQHREVTAWNRYKEVAKRYILEHTSDPHYYENKEKEDSLRNVMTNRTSPERYRVFMRDDFRPVSELVPEDAAPRFQRLVSAAREYFPIAGVADHART